MSSRFDVDVAKLTGDDLELLFCEVVHYLGPERVAGAVRRLSRDSAVLLLETLEGMLEEEKV